MSFTLKILYALISTIPPIGGRVLATTPTTPGTPTAQTASSITTTWTIPSGAFPFRTSVTSFKWLLNEIIVK